jgi:tRNA(Ile)-lysidine synthase
MTYDLPLTTLLATAHHADDNIETLLLNFFRGTGISGLHGILPKQGNIIRPLLFAKREEIVAYAKENNLSWVEDSSNASDKYSRNFVRHQVVPLMKTIYPQVDDNLLANIERFKEIELIYSASIQQTKSKLIEVKGNESHISILKLKRQTPLKTIVFEIIKDFGFAATQTEEAIKLLDAANGSFMVSASHRLIINRNWLIIAPLQAEEALNIIIEEGIKNIAYDGGTLSFETTPADNTHFPTDATIATLNADEIRYPLLLRPYKQGDYFYPLGMLKKKKLSKFFIDQKLSKTDKERVWVIESDKRIVWVIGLRIDNRFRIKPTSKKQLTIKYSS